MLLKEALELLWADDPFCKGLEAAQEALKVLDKGLIQRIKDEIEEVKSEALKFAMVKHPEGGPFELCGEKFRYVKGEKYMVIDPKAYDLIDRFEPGIVKRDPSIHCATLAKFMKDCSEKSKKLLIDEKLVQVQPVHEIKIGG